MLNSRCFETNSGLFCESSEGHNPPLHPLRIRYFHSAYRHFGKVSLKMYNRSRRSEYQLTKSFIVLVVSGTRLGLHVADRKLDTNMADACKENRLEKGSVRTHCRPGDSRLWDERDTITMSTLNWLSLSTFAYTPMFLEQDENRKWIDKMRTICNWF